MDLRRSLPSREGLSEARSAFRLMLHFRSRGDPATAESRARECLRTRTGHERVTALMLLESWAHARFLGRRGWTVTWAALNDVLRGEIEDQVMRTSDAEETEALTTILDLLGQRRRQWRLDEPTEALVRARCKAITER